MLLLKLALATLLTIASATRRLGHDGWGLNPTTTESNNYTDPGYYGPYQPTCPCNNGDGSAIDECVHSQEHCASCNTGYELITHYTTYHIVVCNECPVGKYSGNGDLSCKECPPGFVSEVAAMECTACLAGKYQDDAVDLSCKECPVGKFQDQTNQESCKDCNAGMYNDQTGQQSCTHCEDGKTTVKGTNSAAADCAAPVTQADVEAAYADGAASVTPEDGIGQADVDAAYADGAASVKASESELVAAYKVLKNC